MESQEEVSTLQRSKKNYGSKDIAATKARMGYAPRKGLAGRIAYWNALQKIPIGAKGAWDYLYGFDASKVTMDNYKRLPQDSLYRLENYTAYKAALKRRGEARKAERAKFSPEEYDKYRRRARLLAAARKELSAKRKARREELKTTGDIHWGPYTAYDYRAPMETAVQKLIDSTPDFRGIDKADIMETLMAKDHPSFFNAYTGKIEGWAQRGVYQRPKYHGISYTGRQEVDYGNPYEERDAAAIGATPYQPPMQTDNAAAAAASTQ